MLAWNHRRVTLPTGPGEAWGSNAPRDLSRDHGARRRPPVACPCVFPFPEESPEVAPPVLSLSDIRNQAGGTLLTV